jgi:hypothetical protein
MSLGSGATLRLGDYVEQASKSAWGLGKIISISERQNATIFFLGVERGSFKPRLLN